MGDRELLEWAAKAAGIDVAYVDDRGVVPTGTREDGPSAGTWNPLTNDGDALRLAVKLRLFVEIWHDMVRCTNTHRITGDSDAWVKIDSDSYAATRRAITRAAAEIGKATASAGEVDGKAEVVPCQNAVHMAEHACKNRAQCWEPCGELGHSAEHARVVDEKEFCAICGLGRHVACHRTALGGPRKGKPLGHAFKAAPAGERGKA